MVADLIQMELAHVNTAHPDFIDAGAGKIFRK